MTIDKIALLDVVCNRAQDLMRLSEDEKANMRLSLLFAHDSAGRVIDIKKLAAFPDMCFVHDVEGIDRHSSREHDECGLLKDLFVPRCGMIKDEDFGVR